MNTDKLKNVFQLKKGKIKMNNYNDFNQTDFVSKIGRLKRNTDVKSSQSFVTLLRSLFKKNDMSLENWGKIESKKYCRIDEIKNHESQFDV